jgi:hypothetical protein
VFVGDLDISMLAVGDEVDITGVTAEFNGLTEIDASAGSVTETGVSGVVIEPEVLPIATFGNAMLAEPWEGVHVRVEGDPLTEAARLVAGGGQPVDPDYRTLWPGVEIGSVLATDGVLLVDIPSDGFTDRPDGMSRRDARLAVQQLVRTLQGVQQERVPVQVQREGGVPLFGLSTATPFEAAGTLRTLNLVNITSPAEGDTVSGDTLTVTGVASSFEASGPCRLLQGGKEIAVEGYQSAGWMGDRLYPFEVDLPLGDVSGEVVVQCETDDPTGGTEGNGPAVDTKTITVVD